MTALLDTEPTEAEAVPEPPPPPEAPRSRWTQPRVLLLIAAIVVVTDQGSKWWALSHAGFVRINPGAVVGSPRWVQDLYSSPLGGAVADLLGVVVLVVVTRWLLRRTRPWALLVGGALVVGGEAGNAVSRLGATRLLVPWSGRGIIDWIDLPGPGVWNVADVAEGAGWVVLLVAAVVWAARRWRGRTVASLVLVGLVVAGAVSTASIDRANALPPAPSAGTLIGNIETRLPPPAPGVALTEDIRSVSRGPTAPGPDVTATFAVTEPNGLRAQVPARFVSSALDQHGRLPTFVYEAAAAQVPIADGAETMWVVVPMGKPSTAEPILVQAADNIVVYLPRLPSSSADLTTSKTEAVKAVAWVADGWGSAQE